MGERTGGNGHATSDAVSRAVRGIGTRESQAGPLGDERHHCGTSSDAWNTASGSLKTTLTRRIVARDKRDCRDERGFEVRSSRFSERRIPNFGSRPSCIPRASRAMVHGRGRHFSTSGKGRNRSAAQDVSGENGSVTPGRSRQRCACPTDASSCRRSAYLSIGTVRSTIRSQHQRVKRYQSMPAS